MVYKNCEDLHLLELIRKGDKKAFSELYNRYWKKLFAVAYNRLKDEESAKEAIQNIFLSIWNRRETLVLTHSLSTYLSTAVKYQIINVLSKQIKTKELTNNLANNYEIGIESTDEWINEKELKAKIDNYIHNLPSKAKIIFKMSRVEGKTNNQISSELNIAEKTVEGHITKALKILRNNLKFTNNISKLVIITISIFFL